MIFPETKTFDITEFKADVDNMTVEGVGSVFRSEHDEDDTDATGDRIIKGAFLKTIDDRLPKNLIKYGINHRHMVGTFDVLQETRTGLEFKATIAPTAVGRDHVIDVKHGVIAHSSIGFQIKRVEVVRDDEGSFKGRIIREVKLWEISGVNFPADEDTTAAAKAHVEAMQAKLSFDLEDETHIKELTGLVEMIIEQHYEKLSRDLDDAVVIEARRKTVLELGGDQKAKVITAAEQLLKSLGVDTAADNSLPSGNEDYLATKFADFTARVGR